MTPDWLHIARQLQSIAQAGLTYSENKYDLDRYRQIMDLSIQIIQEHTDYSTDKIRNLLSFEKGYLTPKLDVRAVVFRNDKILMVRESLDGLWTLPGGWADVGFSPFEIATKEVLEEAGMHVKPIRLLAVMDKLKHNHPPDLYHIYKIFIECEDSGEDVHPGMETTDVQWFTRGNIPELSPLRISYEQIMTMFEFHDDQNKTVICD